MIASATLALRKAVREVLIADQGLAARLGGARIYDEAPAQVEPPYVAFADVRTRDWSSASGSGAEHFLALEIWSKHRGVLECLEIAGLIEGVLDDAPLQVEGRHLVLIQLQSTETIRRDKGRLALARVTFRALTEET
ncbi:MAG: DUF3168 domain-containing protein [Beijerinckiaceae bacterium]